MKRAAVEEVNNLMLPVAAAKRIAVGKTYDLKFPVAMRLGGTHVHIPNTMVKT